MNNLEAKDKKLPLIKNKQTSTKNLLPIDKISKKKRKKQSCEAERCGRKLSLKEQENFKTERRTFSQKKFSLEKIPISKALKTSKDIEANTDDNSESEKSDKQNFDNNLKFKDIQSIHVKAVNLLKGMKEVEKVAKLYKKPEELNKNSTNQESKKMLKNKYKCLVNPYVFVKKAKLNKSDEAKPSSEKINKKHKSGLMDDFWCQIDESLIMESCRHEEPSKELKDLVENILTEF